MVPGNPRETDQFGPEKYITTTISELRKQVESGEIKFFGETELRPALEVMAGMLQVQGLTCSVEPDYIPSTHILNPRARVPDTSRTVAQVVLQSTDNQRYLVWVERNGPAYVVKYTKYAIKEH